MAGMAAAAAGTAVGGLAACGPRGPGADTIFVGGPVVTVVPGVPEAEALAVSGGRIVKVGSRDDVLRLRGSGTTVVDLRGRALLPAFIEPHGHPFEMGTTLAPPAIDVRPFTVSTAGGVFAKLTEAVDDTPKGQPILLNGVDPLLQTGLKPFSRKELDRLAPNNPVVIISNSGHAAYANTAAFAAAGITKTTPNPVGAQFMRGPDGQLTGEVREVAALMALAAPFFGAVTANAGDNLRWAYAQLARAGIATATEHSYDSRTQSEVYSKLAAQEDCAIRVRAYEVGTQELADTPNHVRGKRSGADVLFDKIGMKIWADGSPWQGNIFTTFPYLTNATTASMELGPNHRGQMNYSPEQIQQLTAAFVDQRWQVSVHVHGDAAIDVVLDAFEKAKVPPALRPRIEHVGAITPEQCARAAQLGVTPSMFIEHVYFWGDVLVDKLFGPEHGSTWMSARSAVDAGLRLSFHNDGTVTPPDPIGNIATAVNRIAKGSGRVLAPEQRIGIDEAIRAQTLNAAWQLRLDTEIGSLEPGKYADLVVLSANPRRVPPAELRDVAVEATYLMGRQTYGKLLG
ncbi:amidohydrolase family protein [Mycolicibacter sp. MYC123]|uniref:Amidohydrolase family protein n=3 Tax=Mycolicibacter TaxID=1073531 RepID=A0ABU5YGQ8_9MYCO|nr:amidohydrolase [Mycolicibacter sp. MYC017]MEB3048609.1 amidohydrolase family protein [Mycolicibacter sp. MYC123]MEB3068480.1 amidohydrolase family protein [Mycolicibacter sp. MYC017]